MKRALALSLVFTAWQTGCADTGSSVTTASSPLFDATPSNVTNVVAVRTERRIDAQLCTGILLLPNLVLTARHCLTGDRTTIESGNCDTATVASADEKTRVTVVTGKDVDLAFAPQSYAVKEAWLPEDDAKLCGQDLALLYLVEPIEDTPLSLTTKVPPIGSAFTAYGYGLADGDYGQQRMTPEATIDCVGKDCDDERLVDNELLAQSGACEGDSGGPAIDDDGAVFAVASRSTSDCSETAYVTFADHFDWLAGATRKAALEGDFEEPEWATLAHGTEAEEPEASNSDNRNTALHATGGCALATSHPQTPRRLICLAIALFSCALRKRRHRS